MITVYKAIEFLTGSVIASCTSKTYLLSKVGNNDDTILNQYQFPNTTILLPTLNEEWMIEKTLQSIKNQNIYKLYPERFEILVIDSNSEDKTIEIAKNYVDKIIIMEERDLVKARTLGIQESKGDMIVFIDADTIYPLNWLNSMLKHYHKDSNIVAVSGPEFHSDIHLLVDIYEPIIITLLSSLAKYNFPIKGTNPMIGHNSSCYKWAFNMIEGFSVPFNYDIKSSKDTQTVLERHFADKLKKVGKYIYDPQLIVFDFGGKRRFLYSTRKDTCSPNKMTKENKYICNYWNEREKRIRF